MKDEFQYAVNDRLCDYSELHDLFFPQREELYRAMYDILGQQNFGGGAVWLLQLPS